MIRVSCTTNLNKYKIDSYRVYSENDILLFLSTTSILSVFKLEVEPDGLLDNIELCTTDSLLEAAEAADRQELVELLVSSTDYTRTTITLNNIELEAYEFECDGIAIPWHNLQPLLRKLPRHVVVNLLKSSMFSLDSTAMVSIPNASQLLRKYKKQTTTKKSTRGFSKL